MVGNHEISAGHDPRVHGNEVHVSLKYKGPVPPSAPPKRTGEIHKMSTGKCPAGA